MTQEELDHIAEVDIERRNPLVKEKFMEGNRQKFTVILLVSMFIVMAVNVVYNIEPQSYLTFLTFIGTFYLGGATLTAWVAANKSNTSNVNTTSVITKTTDENSKVNVSVESKNDENINIHEEKFESINIEEYIKVEGKNAPQEKPFGHAAQETDEDAEIIQEMRRAGEIENTDLKND